MANPVKVELKSEGASAVLSALRSVREVLADIEVRRRVRVDTAASAGAVSDHAARIKAAKAEILALEALTKARTAARESGGSAGGGASLGGSRGSRSHDDWETLSKKIAHKFTAANLAMDAFGGMVGMATSALRQFGGFLLSDVVKPAMALETRATQVANNSGGKLTADDVQAKAKAVALKNNMDPMALIDAAGLFQDATGEPGVGFDVLNTIATISKGRGFDTKDLAGFAGALYKPGMKASELSDLLLAQTAQGTSGSVTIGQLAKLGGKVTAPAASLAGDYSTRIAMTGALLQSSRKGFGSVEEAATGLQTLMSDAMLHGKTVSPKSFVKDASGVEKLADPAKFIADVYRKTSGNSARLHAMQFSDPTSKLIGSYKETFGEAFNASKAEGKSDAAAKEDAAKAVEAFIKSFVTASTTMAAEESKRNTVMKTAGERYEEAMNRVKEKSLAVMPAITGAIDHFAANADAVGDASVAMAKAMVSVAETIVDVANGIARVKGWFADDGDVIRTAVDKGDDTRLPNVKDEGYWKKGDAGFEYIKGKMGEGADAGGEWKRVGKGGNLAFYPGSGAPKGNALDFGFSAAANEPNASVNAEMTPADGSGDSANAASSSAVDLADNMTKASGAVDKLSSSLDEMASKLDQLSRSTAFTDR